MQLGPTYDYLRGVLKDSASIVVGFLTGVEERKEVLLAYPAIPINWVDFGRDPWSQFGSAAANGALPAARWMTEKYALADCVIDRTNPRRIFTSVCFEGHLAVAQWLATTFRITAEDVRSRENQALWSACRNGHLTVVQWLTNEFKLTAEDVRSKKNRASWSACWHGHLTVVQWLTNEFKLTADDIRVDGNAALSGACHNGHLETVQWLVETFALTIADARAAIALIRARGKQPLTDWLIAQFAFTQDEIGVAKEIAQRYPAFL
jgi:hypothetical protein